jgi:hypothetical protein
MEPPARTSGPALRWATLALGALTFGVLLAARNIADGDLWAKLAVGAEVWLRGELPTRDRFAFTPTLPNYVDHEWGAGLIFYAVLRLVGPGGLMALKIALALGALFAALATARRLGANWNALLVLALPAAACLVPGYGPVIRSHTFTYCFFGVTLLCLELIRSGRSRAVIPLTVVMAVWTNVHGGCVAGLGTIGVYAAWALVERKQVRPMLLALAAGVLATFLNPHGPKFWLVLLPGVLHPRERITEWQPLPLWADDPFLAFRLLFLAVLVIVALGWRRTEKPSWPGLVMLALTAFLGWRSRRHAPFFAVATLAFAAPFLEAAGAALAEKFRAKLKPAVAVLALYGLVAAYGAAQFLPRASFVVLAPIPHDPVREMDILSLAGAEGNLATPFGWGSYCAWRLHPRVKISMDGRYEAAFPESTFQLNNDFYERRGPNWDRLIREFTVDYVLLEYHQERLRPADLLDKGYVLIWENPGWSALLAREQHAAKLRAVATNLPPTTINPLDATIPEKWWPR